MAKYYFLINCFLWTLCGQAQNCGWANLLEVPHEWTGNTDRFMSFSDGWKLSDSRADTAKVTFYAETPIKVLQFTFSLDFPPSDKNRFSMTIEFQDTEGANSGFVVLSIGETGGQDGVRMSYHSAGQLVSEANFWKGAYGGGVKRTSWILGTNNTGMTIRQGAEDQDQFLPWKEQSEMNLVISSITLQCIYTKTRSSHFIFHHLYTSAGTKYIDTKVDRGDLFISEYRYTQNRSRNFIELYNAFTEPRCLTGLRIQIDNVVREIPPLSIEPGSYILLVDSTFDFTLDPLIKRVSFDFAFVNKGESEGIRLLNFDHLLHVVYPSDDDNDGFSWEMADIIQPCRTDNWEQSMAREGTPGLENSWFYSLDSAKMRFHWMNTQTGVLTYPYLLLDPEGTKQYITTNHPFELKVKNNRSALELHFTDEFLPEDTVVITVKGTFLGCGMETITWDTVFTEIPPQSGIVGGLLFTELMYDPPTSCPEYVEITNMESRMTWWNKLRIQKGDGGAFFLELPFAWPSGQSRMITADRDQFLRCYQETDPELVFPASLFALTNRGATLLLIDHETEDRIIDEVSYSPSDHNDLFKNTKGVALERNLLTSPNNKWRSGFVQFGYRSPGFLPEWNLDLDVNVTFSTSTIYSQNGNSPSFLEIAISSNGEVGGSITIEIFDLKGGKMETFVDAVPIQGGELFTWKGRTKTGLLLPEGVYLFWIYYFDLKGRKRIFKKTCVLSNN